MRRPGRLREIGSWDEVPEFGAEKEEVQFWSEHGLGDALLDSMAPPGEEVLPPARPRAGPIAVRFDRETVRRLKSLAAVKGKGYQTLLKEFVIQRLYEEEKREGLVG